ncbi:hypothetical protein [Halalkalibacterium ligniniphilum]|uniref:hypothetical protein n=1 Tax=Halalkalibacterium ligniniphilum TaxID=1134413 RepID=UPI00034620A6|nr:hypothetical protein [Halalkalibacterium ligniniphilum]
MKKKWTLLSTVVAGVAGAATVILQDEKKREKAKSMVKQTYEKIKKKNNLDATNQKLKIGHPDPHDTEDAKMVGEGALYSVKYYNHHEQENSKPS